MKILAISFFDPASVVLSHRDLMRAAGHDFRLAVVRAYTDRQRQADYVTEHMTVTETPVSPGVVRQDVKFVPVPFDKEGLQAFAAEADVIQFHPGIGHGDGDWASRGEPHGVTPEEVDVLKRLGFRCIRTHATRIAFVHGSNSAWKHLSVFRNVLRDAFIHIATSTLDYAVELNAAYLPPFVDVGNRRAALRTEHDPFIVAHTPTDRVACSTEAFLNAANSVGAIVRLGEHLTHADCLDLKAECHAGFDHLRGAFSVNTLENAALGLVPLVGVSANYYRQAEIEGIGQPPGSVPTYNNADVGAKLHATLQTLEADWELTAALQQTALGWFLNNFNADAITKRLVRFYESL